MTHREALDCLESLLKDASLSPENTKSVPDWDFRDPENWREMRYKLLRVREFLDLLDRDVHGKLSCLMTEETKLVPHRTVWGGKLRWVWVADNVSGELYDNHDVIQGYPEPVADTLEELIITTQDDDEESNL